MSLELYRFAARCLSMLEVIQIKFPLKTGVSSVVQTVVSFIFLILTRKKRSVGGAAKACQTVEVEGHAMKRPGRRPGRFCPLALHLHPNPRLLFFTSPYSRISLDLPLHLDIYFFIHVAIRISLHCAFVIILHFDPSPRPPPQPVLAPPPSIPPPPPTCLPPPRPQTRSSSEQTGPFFIVVMLLSLGIGKFVEVLRRLQVSPKFFFLRS